MLMFNQYNIIILHINWTEHTKRETELMFLIKMVLYSLFNVTHKQTYKPPSEVLFF